MYINIVLQILFRHVSAKILHLQELRVRSFKPAKTVQTVLINSQLAILCSLYGIYAADTIGYEFYRQYQLH